MENLLELLNDYEPYIQSDGTHTDNFWWYVSQGHSAVFPKEVGVERIISKSYGFIKWLVENDKIDFSWEGGLANELVALFDRVKDDDEGVTALLSIQDKPIEFLISILK